MTEASEYLLRRAREMILPYTRHPEGRAAMVTGSVSEGKSDFFSDVDMTVYYADALPTEEELADARRANGGGDRIWLIGDRAGGSMAEAYNVDGIEIQIGHALIAAWERDIEAVRSGDEVATPLHKAMSGTLDCIPLYGDELLIAWKARIADFPDDLARRMAEHYLRFFPIWGLQERMMNRDTLLWRQQTLLETAQNILGVLAALNRLYYSTFQFKRMRSFIGKMKIAPDNLAERLETLLMAEPAVAAATAEKLVEELCALVETHLPEVETAKVRQRLGWRQQAWSVSSE